MPSAQRNCEKWSLAHTDPSPIGAHTILTRPCATRQSGSKLSTKLATSWPDEVFCLQMASAGSLALVAQSQTALTHG